MLPSTSSGVNTTTFASRRPYYAGKKRCGYFLSPRSRETALPKMPTIGPSRPGRKPTPTPLKIITARVKNVPYSDSNGAWRRGDAAVVAAAAARRPDGEGPVAEPVEAATRNENIEEDLEGGVGLRTCSHLPSDAVIPRLSPLRSALIWGVARIDAGDAARGCGAGTP